MGLKGKHKHKNYVHIDSMYTNMCIQVVQCSVFQSWSSWNTALHGLDVSGSNTPDLNEWLVIRPTAELIKLPNSKYEVVKISISSSSHNIKNVV